MTLDVRYFPINGTYEETDELTGLRAHFHYGSGNLLEQFYSAPGTMVWTGITGDFAGVEQTEPTLRVFKTGPHQYFSTWYEEGTVASAEHGQVFGGGYPISVIFDLEAKIATAAYTNPREDGGQYFLVDQATIEILDLPHAARGANLETAPKTQPR